MAGLINDALPSRFAVQALGILFAFWLVAGCWLNYRKLSQFKGPFWAACSRSWIFWHECNARLNQRQAEALKQYGMSSTLHSEPEF